MEENAIVLLGKSMRKCYIWMLAAGVAGLFALSLHRLMGQSGLSLYLGYGIGYAGFAMLLLLALKQCRPGWHPAMQRMVTLLAGAGLAGVDVLIAGLAGESAQQAFFSALLGVALVQVMSKFLGTESRK
jgi:low temperature requirement protein LtrA